MKVWKQFDTDCSGYIEADELKQFIKALLNRRQGNKVTEEKLIEYTDTMVCRTFVRLLYFFKIFISL
jgi:Ca2+-binding EF-hand superfamily protein